ncbi:MAG: hypothetical protein KC457_32530, partial [Myxococcales bacterium]|nr:hypothetical protein [Myxococcales bacterium]
RKKPRGDVIAAIDSRRRRLQAGPCAGQTTVETALAAVGVVEVPEPAAPTRPSEEYEPAHGPYEMDSGAVPDDTTELRFVGSDQVEVMQLVVAWCKHRGIRFDGTLTPDMHGAPSCLLIGREPQIDGEPENEDLELGTLRVIMIEDSPGELRFAREIVLELDVLFDVDCVSCGQAVTFVDVVTGVEGWEPDALICQNCYHSSPGAA